METIGLLVRLGLIFVTGFLAREGYDGDLVQILRDDPEVIAAVTALIWGAWYFLARRFGWQR